MHFKFGEISDSKPGFARVVFPQDDNLVTDWLPLAMPFTVHVRAIWTLRVKTQVAVLLNEDCTEGVIVGATYNNEDAAPSIAESNVKIYFGSNASVEWSASTSTLKLVAPTVEVTGNLTVLGVVSAGGISAAPITGVTGADGAVSIDGDVTSSGKISAINLEASADVKAGTVSLATHVHSGVTTGGGVSGTPVP